MVACAYGAIRDPSKPKYYRVTEADIERWYPAAGALFYLWMRPYVGRIYDTDALAVLNPDIPNTANWQDFLADALRVWGLTGSTTLSSVADNQVAYNVFLDNCVCLPSAGPFPTTVTVCRASTGLNYASAAVVVPAGATSMNVTLRLTGSGRPNSYWVQLTEQNWTGIPAPGAGGAGRVYCGAHDYVDQFPKTFAGITFAAGATMYVSVAGDNSAGNGCADITFNAGGTGSTTPAPTPTQPVWTNLPAYTAPSGTTNDQLEVKLDALVNMVASMTDWTKATQRQSVPFAYIPGAVHAGLTGTGQIAVAGLLGLAVHFTSIPARLPVSAGTPDQIWELGHISLGTADGWQRNITLTHSPALVVPVSGFVTKVGYTLPLGVAATITELKAEP